MAIGPDSARMVIIVPKKLKAQAFEVAKANNTTPARIIKTLLTAYIQAERGDMGYRPGQGYPADRDQRLDLSTDGMRRRIKQARTQLRKATDESNDPQ